MAPFAPYVVGARELARALGITKRTLRRWVSAGTLATPGRTDGGHWRWSIAVAADEVRRRGLDVPRDWEATSSSAA